MAFKQGRYSEAAASFEQALAIYTRVLGVTHPNTRNAEQLLRAAQQKVEIQNQ